MKFVIYGMIFLSFLLMGPPITFAGAENPKDAQKTIAGV